MVRPLLIRLIRGYQARGGGATLLIACNFTPSCSEYAVQALEKYGLWRGIGLAFHRIRRCRDPNRLQPLDDPLS
ncbi:MAG: membrane protein insertion efficiency factor YidD [Magnetococcales bacterium]|nr:membrane protein insertion efficiency factor YidD [Magnetococcales bacterium]